MKVHDDTLYFNNARPEIVDLVPSDSRRILDVGCNNGSFGKIIKEKLNAEVWGVELNKTAGEFAILKLDNVIIGDINEVLPELPNGYFDCICFNDVIEHLIDPWHLLMSIKEKLTDEGIIICSIPNIRHSSILKEYLFKGEWNYQNSGILDWTHLRFFTHKNIIRMFSNLDYEILKMKGINPTGSLKYKIMNILLFNLFWDCRYLQFVCIAKPVREKQND